MDAMINRSAKYEASPGFNKSKGDVFLLPHLEFRVVGGKEDGNRGRRRFESVTGERIVGKVEDHRRWVEMVPKRRPQPAGSGRGALVSVRCHFDWLDEVVKLLSSENMARLRNSCFGHLFNVPYIQFQGQLYHILVRNHLITEIPIHLCFNLNGRVFEFGPVEFGLITGLKFSGILKFIDISAAFRTECKRTGGRSILSLKLAFLFVLYAVILPRDRKEKNIEMQYMHLVDDLQRFEDYPWGRVSYDYLVSATHSRREVIDGLIRQKKRMAYDAFGFVIALQTWAYEVMPALARDCASVEKRNLSSRVFWSIGETYVPPKVYVKPPVKRKAPEADGAGVESKKGKIAPDAMKDRFRSVKAKEKAVHLDSAESKSEALKDRGKEGLVEEILNNEIDAQIKALGRRFDVIEALIRRCKCCWREAAPEAVVDEKDVPGNDVDEKPVVAECDEEVDQAFVEALLREVFEGEDEDANRSGEMAEEKLEKGRDDINAGAMRFDELADKEVGSSSKAHKGSGFVQNSAPYRVATRSRTRGLETPVMNRFERKLVDKEEELELDTSLLKASPKSARPFSAKSVARQLFSTGNNNEPEMTLPIISKLIVNARWFVDLWKRRGWLADEHIDALTNLLLFKYKRGKDRFLDGWSVLDALGIGFLRVGQFERTADSLLEYISGRFPREGGLPWVDAEQVVGVANVNKNHWVCYRIHFASQTVTIMDSMRGTNNWRVIAEQFDHMLRYIPWLLRHFGIWEQKKFADGELRDVWELVDCEEAPQQTNNHDCGIMALKFLECLACGEELSIIHPGRCGIFRRSYCAQLFELGRAFPARQ
ncbi:hypothetical protein C2S52_014896 [Perilla frutescens var. hirtella]|nr:hypothetical protein C2S52_014896 [Perilla frutescens var. hirtella]